MAPTEQPDPWACSGGTALPGLARAEVARVLIGEPQPAVALNAYLAQRRGVFVTIWHPRRGLRGCRGTIHPAREDLVAETRTNALSAAFRDWRCPPVTSIELDEIHFEISVLGEVEPVCSQEELDPSTFGVVMQAKDGRHALLLPGIEAIETVEQQLDAVRRKAGISFGEPTDLMRFRVEKFRERAG